MAYYKRCEYCGAYLDVGEKCDCGKKDIKKAPDDEGTSPRESVGKTNDRMCDLIIARLKEKVNRFD